MPFTRQAQASPAQQGATPERSKADAHELMQKIVARMPTDKADVFAYPIAWAAFDGGFCGCLSGPEPALVDPAASGLLLF
jgi:hypothetical protein